VKALSGHAAREINETRKLLENTCRGLFLNIIKRGRKKAAYAAFVRKHEYAVCISLVTQLDKTLELGYRSMKHTLRVISKMSNFVILRSYLHAKVTWRMLFRASSMATLLISISIVNFKYREMRLLPGTRYKPIKRHIFSSLSSRVMMREPASLFALAFRV